MKLLADRVGKILDRFGCLAINAEPVKLLADSLEHLREMEFATSSLMRRMTRIC